MSESRMPTRFGLGLAAIGRPAYITVGRDRDLGDAGSRSVAELQQRAHALLDAAWAGGVRYLDAARSYGLAERFLGAWLAQHPERRSALTIASKWGYEYVGGWRMDADVHERKEHSPAMLARQWPQTVAELGTTPDIYYVHSITPESPALADTALLDRLRGLAGRGVRVGLTTSGPAQGDVLDRARELTDSPFRAVQSTWNVLEQSAGPALARAHDAGWLVVVKEALANGRLAGAGVNPAVAVAAARHGRSPQAFSIGAALANPWADRVLSGAVTPRQLIENLTARPVRLSDGESASLAVAPERYWRERSLLSWT